MGTDDEGELRHRTARSRHHTRARRILPWVTLAVVATIGLVGAVTGTGPGRAGALDHASAARATRPVRRTTPGVAIHAVGATDIGSPTAPPPTATPWAPGTQVPGGADESDPFLTTAGGRYLLFTSGTTGPAAVNVPVATSTDFVHWTPPVDALPVLPVWAVSGFTWAPDLHRFGSLYALYFTAVVAGYSPQSECIGSSFSTSPTGPFTAQPAPLICQLDQGGDIDPRVFVDSDGTPWMVWKTDQNIGGSDTPTMMWSQRLSADGTHLLGSPSFLLSPDEPWQGTIVEAPDMVEVDGGYWVVYSANWYNSTNYAVGVARCAGPAGPCQDTSAAPLLASNLQGQGPGEASVFHDAAGVWMLYSPWRSLAPHPDIPARPVDITRLGFGPAGPYLASGPLPSAADLLARPLWAPTP